MPLRQQGNAGGSPCANTAATSMRPLSYARSQPAAAQKARTPMPTMSSQTWAGQERGAVGSPHFFAAVGNWFRPSRVSHRHHPLPMATNADGFDRYTRACLAD
jgi:hypothetical protein